MDFEWHGFEMGGHWVDEDMLGGGMMGGHVHMDDDWQHHNGTYGMMILRRLGHRGVRSGHADPAILVGLIP